MIEFIEKKCVLATHDLKCDACRYLIEESLRMVSEVRCRLLPLIYSCKYNKITKGEEYVEYSFMDDETGEAINFNAKKIMDSKMLAAKLYPKYFLIETIK